MLLQNHVWVEDPVQVQERPMDFDVAEYEKFIIGFQIPHYNKSLRIYSLSFSIMLRMNIYNDEID